VRPSFFGTLSSSLALAVGCSETPARETPTPTPAPAATLAYAETDVPGTLRAFEVDDRTGALTARTDATPSGTPEAPIVSPGPFAIQPGGRLLFYSYDSCREGWCGNVSSYEIGADGTLRLLAHDGPRSLEGGIEVFFATPTRLVTHWDDAPFHSLTFYAVDGYGGLAPGGGLFLGYGYRNVPRPFRITPDGRWAYGLTDEALVSYRLNEGGQGAEATRRALPATGRGLELHSTGRFLYVALDTAPPRIDVYRIDGTGLLPGAVGTIAAGEVLSLALDPSGLHLFSATTVGIDVYGVDPTGGLLTWSGHEPLADLDDISVHPSGTFLYASRKDGTLWGYAIDASTGALRDAGVRARGRRPQFARIPATAQLSRP
jgi:6-phosphogluconolactonase (cycloisomerase 2 family)